LQLIYPRLEKRLLNALDFNCDREYTEGVRVIRLSRPMTRGWMPYKDSTVTLSVGILRISNGIVRQTEELSLSDLSFDTTRPTAHV